MPVVGAQHRKLCGSTAIPGEPTNDEDSDGRSGIDDDVRSRDVFGNVPRIGNHHRRVVHSCVVAVASPGRTAGTRAADTEVDVVNVVDERATR